MKKKVPRKLKKQINKANLIIDYVSIPQNMGATMMERIQTQHRVFKESGILYWDSSNVGAVKPEIVGQKTKLKIIDKSKIK